MNERNVDALTEICDEWLCGDAPRGMAKFLASRGVLVPSVLEVKHQLALDAAVECFPAEDHKALAQTIDVLERAAKGEI